jgi:hypothetical protein
LELPLILWGGMMIRWRKLLRYFHAHDSEFCNSKSTDTTNQYRCNGWSFSSLDCILTTHWNCFQEVSGSNLGKVRGYRDWGFLSFSLIPPGGYRDLAKFEALLAHISFLGCNTIAGRYQYFGATCCLHLQSIP